MSKSSSSSSDDSSDDDLVPFITAVTLYEKSDHGPKGGSSAGRSPNRNIGKQVRATQIDQNYFQRNSFDPPIFSEYEFQRRFAVTRTFYEEIRRVVCPLDPYSTENRCHRANGSFNRSETLCSSLTAKLRSICYTLSFIHSTK